MRKPVFGVSDHVRHKPGCKTTEDGQRLERTFDGLGDIRPIFERPELRFKAYATVPFQ